MTAGIVLAPGHKLLTHDARAFCSLGLVVQAEDGRSIGLTSRQILERERDPRVYDAVSGHLVGRRIDLPKPNTKDQYEFFELIGAFEIDSEDSSFDSSSALTASVGIAEPQSVIGQTVYKLGGACERIPALAIGYGGSITLVDDRNSTEIIYRNVLEISFNADCEEDPAGPYEAGSLVLDGDGLAVGLMIAGDRHCCYVAPLEPFLLLHELSLVDLPAEEGDVDDEDLLEDLSTDYRGAMIGAILIKSDLQNEGVETPDPHSEPLTDRQLAALDF